MKIEWNYNNYNFELKFFELTEPQLKKIIRFLKKFDEEDKL